MTIFKAGQKLSRSLPAQIKRAGLLVVATLAILALAVTPAFAEVAAPGFEVTGRAVPTNLPPGGNGVVALYVYNLGAARSGSGATLTDALPEGLTAETGSKMHDPYNAGLHSECAGAGSQTVTCELFPVGTGYPHNIETIEIPVAVKAGASGSAVDHVTVGGGGALSTASASVPVAFGSAAPGPGFADLSAWLTNPDGQIDTQAGSHPFDLTVAFALNNTVHGEETLPEGRGIRSVNVNLPAGLIGDPQAVPQCPRSVLDDSQSELKCPEDTEVGENEASLSTSPGLGAAEPVFNIVPPPGVAAQFAFAESGSDVFLDSGVRTGGDNGITTHADDLPQQGLFTFNSTTIWGVPADAGHNEERCIEGRGPEEEAECSAEYAKVPSTPLLTLGTSCQGPLEFSAEELGTWQEEHVVLPPASEVTRDSTGNPVGLTGCERLQPFKPSIAIAPDTTAADTPAGLSATVTMPQGLNPEGLASSNLKNTTVALPEGVVINPGQAKGLVACQPAQEALGDEPDGEVDEQAPSCPNASKVGEDEILTPLLRGPLKGSVYILQQNPPNLKLLVAASGYGVNLKLVGNVKLNEATGQLTTTFENTPDIPFTEFKLAFSGGAQAALATPTGCGTYESSVAFTPWSSPFIEEAFDSSRFQITSAPAAGGGSCSAPLPFTPTLTAGATSSLAGGYTDFSMLLQRGDGQQRIDGLQFKAPAGLTGFLSHVPLCTNAQAESNTCPESSKIGHTVVESGPGPYPLVIPEAGQEPAPIYLTEAYGGAPFGLSIVVPLHVGPFTLETQRVRARIEIDPYTSQLTVTTNPLPQEVAGIPTDLREVDAVIERPEFMVDPTHCAPASFSGTASGTPAPGQGGPGASAAISTSFDVVGCKGLTFEPKFTVSTTGKTSKANGASLTAKLTYPSVPQGTDADVGYVKIELPKQLPSRLTTLQKACTSAQFTANPAACPSESKIGYATVHTPLLPVPLTGPVIFVSHGGEAFPSLTVVLQGDGVTIDLVGATYISKAGVTSTTFKTVPDDPFSTFEITLPQGKYSALAANVPTSAHDSLCGQKLTMPTEFVGQNGAVLKQSTAIAITGCAKVKALTRAQKLTKALKVCKRDHKKGKRERCDKAARKDYGAAKTKKKGAAKKQ